MTEETIVTAADLDAARVAQLTVLRDYLVAGVPLINEIRQSEVGGYALWMGGLPQSVQQAETQLTFVINTLTDTFRLPALPAAQPPV